MEEAILLLIYDEKWIIHDTSNPNSFRVNYFPKRIIAMTIILVYIVGFATERFVIYKHTQVQYDE